MALSSDDVNTILRTKLNSNAFEVVSCENFYDENPTIGFLSVQVKVNIKYKLNNEIQELKLFLKKIPESEFHKHAVVSTGAFDKEVRIYNKFLNAIKESLIGTPIPTCYLARECDVIALEDLLQKGFKVLPLHDTYSVSHCEKVIESLAKIHSSSLLYELRNKTRLEEFLPDLRKEILFVDDDNHSGRRAIITGVRALRDFTDKYLAQSYSKEIIDICFQYMYDLPKIMKPSNKHPNVLSHADLWTNNILFKNDHEDNVEECCLVDFQMAAYKPLTFDFHMFMFLCTDKQLRNNHMSHLEQYYYDKLIQMTSDTEFPKLLKLEDYNSLIEETKPVLLAMAPQYLNFVLMPKEIVKEIMGDNEAYKSYYEEDRGPHVLKAAAEYPKYKQRLTEALMDLFDHFLNNQA